MSTIQQAAIELVIAETPSVALLDTKKREELYAFLEREIEAFVPDLSTESSRKQIASLAYKVSRTKTAIDDAGAALKAEWLKKSQAIDLSRREIRDKLDALRDKARKPLTDWEDAKVARAAAFSNAIAMFKAAVIIRADDTSASIGELLNAIETYKIPTDWFPEEQAAALVVKAESTVSLRASLARVQQEEADRLELARLRKEREERAESDRKAVEAAEVARLLKVREEAEALRLVEMEAHRKAAEEHRAKELEERVKREAEATAQKEAAAREARHTAELNQLRESKERIERERLAEQNAAEAREREARQKTMQAEADAATRAEEERKIAANKKHRTALLTAAKVALMEHAGLDEEQARKVVLALSTGKIPAASWSWV